MDPLHAGRLSTSRQTIWFYLMRFSCIYREDSEAEDDEYGGADPIDELISTFQGVVVQCRRKMNVLSHVTTGRRAFYVQVAVLRLELV
eukprot:1344981-Amorphochlora_amoeboformis.AAC.1